MIDQNRDGFIDNEDLKDMLASLGLSLIPFIYSLSYPNLFSLAYRSGAYRCRGGWNDEGCSRSSQLYHVPDPLWRQTNRSVVSDTKIEWERGKFAVVRHKGGRME